MRRLNWPASLSILAACAAGAPAPGSALGPASMDAYAQTLVVTFRSEEAAQRASLRIAPLYHDLRAAFSTRMDDSTVNDLAAAQVMGDFGQRGTFYLNSLRSWYQDSPETGFVLPKNPAVEMPRRLLAGGSSIGGHTLSHEFLPALSKNAAFREIMGIRVALEAGAGTPVNSFTYPFVSFMSEERDGADRADLEEMLRRSGFFQLAEHRYNADWDSGFLDGIFISLDNGGPGDGYSDSVLTEARCEADRPLFLIAMHAWVRAWGGRGFPNLAAIYRKWSNRRDLWYCNQNQYGAYRYQALHSRLAAFVRGNSIRAVLVRPSPLDLNDFTPLTIKVAGVARDDVVSATCAGAQVKVFPLGESYAFDLFHDADRVPVETYAESDAPEGAGQPQEHAGAAEGLEARLERTDAGLALHLHNGGDRALTGIRVVFRLPLLWRDGVVRREVGTIEPRSAVTLELPLSPREDADSYTDGAEYDVAQVDFKGARRARLYAVCESPPREPAPFFARDGFWILGPLAGDKANFDPDAFSLPFMKGGAPEASYTVHWAGTIGWRTLEPAKAAILDPDIIPTSGRPNTPDNYPADASVYFPHKNVHYLLYGRIVSPRDQVVRAVFRRESVRRLSLNGGLVEGDELELRKGDNDVRLLYAPAPEAGTRFDERNYGCYFRLVGANGGRALDVRFERPARP